MLFFMYAFWQRQACNIAVYKDFCNMSKKVKEGISMNQNEFERLAELFKIFGTPTRLQILHALVDEEKCVYDIAEELGMSQSAISHQLSILKQNRLVKNRRDGKTIYYSLLDSHVLTIIAQGLEHIREKPQ